MGVGGVGWGRRLGTGVGVGGGGRTPHVPSFLFFPRCIVCVTIYIGYVQGPLGLVNRAHTVVVFPTRGIRTLEIECIH